MKKLLITLVLTTGLLTMYSCSFRQSSQTNTQPTTTTTSTEETTETTTAEPEANTKPKNPDVFTYNYVHGEEGYFNLLNEEPEFKRKTQDAETCWAYAAAASMETSYFRKTGNSITIEPFSIIDTVWNTDKAEGFIKKVETSNKYMGGRAWMVTETMSNGINGITLDSALILANDNRDAIKNAVQNRGGVYATVPDDDNKKDWYGDYYTMNDTKNTRVDHAVTIIGWDDNFPKNYFNEEASQNGAWITYNSTEGVLGSYYYISYDTPINDVVSFTATDKYSAVLSYDAGNEQDRYISRGEETTVMNVFHQSGTLAAIGTYNDFNEEQDIKIEIYDATFKNLLYTQDATLSFHGYQTIDLDTPVSVGDYAVIITYTKGAPVEGDTIESERSDYRTVSDSRQSFIFLGDWKNKASIFYPVDIPEDAENIPAVDHTYDYIRNIKDMHDGDIRGALGIDFTPNNFCIKALYTN
jgi:C1A family cysteine protease